MAGARDRAMRLAFRAWNLLLKGTICASRNRITVTKCGYKRLLPLAEDLPRGEVRRARGIIECHWHPLRQDERARFVSRIRKRRIVRAHKCRIARSRSNQVRSRGGPQR